MKDRLQKLAQERAEIHAELRKMLDETKDREFTDDEVTKLEDLEKRDAELEKQQAGLTRRERLEKRAATINKSIIPPPPSALNQPTGDSDWRSMGDFLAAVRAAERRGGRIDTRLMPEAAEPATGPGEQRAASGMNEGIGDEGFWLVPPQYSTALLENVMQQTVLAPRCQEIPISNPGNRISLPMGHETSRATGSRWGGVRGYWAGEADTVTASKRKLRTIDLILRKLLGIAYITDELAVDAAATTAWVNRGFENEFRFLIDDAIYNGLGGGMPLGVTRAPCKVEITAEDGQGATVLLAENVTKMLEAMPARLWPDAAFFVHTSLWTHILKLHYVMGQSGTPLYTPPGMFSQNPFGDLLGRPIFPLEQAAAPGTSGDIALLALSEYLIGKKAGTGIDVATSMHVRFLYDEMAYRFKLRLDGKPAWPSKVLAYTGGGYQSPVVMLATRS